MSDARFFDLVKNMPPARRKALLSQAGRQEEKLRCEASLMHFLKCAWPSFDPSTFISGWHLEAIAEHLEAVSRGEIRKLLINIPPRHCKPVWEEEEVWLHGRGPTKLKDVVVGDWIQTHLGRGREVKAVHVQGELPLVVLRTHSGRTVSAAADHPFLVGLVGAKRESWREAGKLKVDDYVIVVHGAFPGSQGSERIAEIGSSTGKCRCLTVDEDKSFVVNGFAVHNTNIVNVAWPAWIWTQQPDADYPLLGAHVRFLCLSYGDQLAADIATTARRLVTSPWYTDFWGDRVKLDPDTMGKGKFDNLRGGSRISTSFAGATLGRGGDIRIYDDANKVTEIESDIERNKVNQTYDEALKSRITDPKTSAEVAVAQRLHSEDLSGHILDTDSDFVHLCLPAEFDGRRCVTVLGWEDQREEGDLLWPERFDEESLQKYRSNPYSWAGQWQQIPVPRGGGILKEQWWGDWVSDKHWPTFDYMIASLDGAYTKDTRNDPSALIVLGVYTDERENRRIMLVEAWRRWLEVNDLVVEVAKSCKEFKVDRLLIENKASGKSVAQELVRLFSGEIFGVELINPLSKDKEARVKAVVSIFTDGLTYDKETKQWEGNRFVNTNLSKDWAQMVVQEMCNFPNAKWDDLTDAVVLALQYLRDTGMAELGWEIRERQTRALQYRRPSHLKPLYTA